ncbi:hypothetical protein FA10DRAFT_140475 [Acaromyces ingoldii]|uniref:DH domain-containing protein n=1 Tax=Acaromyces ingoldii TaxID=215250 RepID=A0A316YMI0_9BASI|nr:hypothetical protein FA10DRAFT_140475 [Acaromyces ingoldii]PWN89273.1 hypothetical protein FA10DRAFT_140475 [Acaromyces ingoldii]
MDSTSLQTLSEEYERPSKTPSDQSVHRVNHVVRQMPFSSDGRIYAMVAPERPPRALQRASIVLPLSPSFNKRACSDFPAQRSTEGVRLPKSTSALPVSSEEGSRRVSRSGEDYMSDEEGVEWEMLTGECSALSQNKVLSPGTVSSSEMTWQSIEQWRRGTTEEPFGLRSDRKSLSEDRSFGCSVPSYSKPGQPRRLTVSGHYPDIDSSKVSQTLQKDQCSDTAADRFHGLCHSKLLSSATPSTTAGSDAVSDCFESAIEGEDNTWQRSNENQGEHWLESARTDRRKHEDPGSDDVSKGKSLHVDAPSLNAPHSDRRLDPVGVQDGFSERMTSVGLDVVATAEDSFTTSLRHVVKSERIRSELAFDALGTEQDRPLIKSWFDPSINKLQSSDPATIGGNKARQRLKDRRRRPRSFSFQDERLFLEETGIEKAVNPRALDDNLEMTSFWPQTNATESCSRVKSSSHLALEKAAQVCLSRNGALADHPTSWRSSMSASTFELFYKRFGSKEMQRQEVIQELCSTEAAFLCHLNLLSDLLQNTLQSDDGQWRQDCPLKLCRFFYWLKDIRKVHRKLSKSFARAQRAHPTPLVVNIAGSTLRHIEGLKAHLPYIVGLNGVICAIDSIIHSGKLSTAAVTETPGLLKTHQTEVDDRYPESKSLAASLQMLDQSPSLGGLPLSSHLLKPVQRLMKYPLFFKQVAELTPVGHPDHLKADKLYTLTEALIRELNEVKAKEEDYSALKLFEAKVDGLPQNFRLALRSRHLIHEGPLLLLDLSEKEISGMKAMDDEEVPSNESSGLALVSTPSYNSIRESMSWSVAGASLSPHVLPLALSGHKTPSEATRSPSHTEKSRHSSRNSIVAPSRADVTAVSAGSKPMCNSTGRLSSVASLMSKMSSSNGKDGGNKSNGCKFSSSASSDSSIRNSVDNAHLAKKCNSDLLGKATPRTSAKFVSVFNDLVIFTDNHVSRRKASKRKGKASSPKSANKYNDDSYDRLQLCTSNGGPFRVLHVRRHRDQLKDYKDIIEVELLPLVDGYTSQCRRAVALFLAATSAHGSVAARETPVKRKTTNVSSIGPWLRAFELSQLHSAHQPNVQDQSHHSTTLWSSGPLTMAMTTAQAEWARREARVTSMIMSAAQKGEREDLTGILQTNMPFPRSPSQQELVDMAGVLLWRAQERCRSSPMSADSPPLHGCDRSFRNRAFATVSQNLFDGPKVLYKEGEDRQSEEMAWWKLRIHETQKEEGERNELQGILNTIEQKGRLARQTAHTA